MDIDSGATQNNISSEGMNASLPMTDNRPTARGEMDHCRNQPEMASFTSFVSASRSAVENDTGVSPESSSILSVPHSTLPENLTTRFQKLSLRSTQESTSSTYGEALDDDDDDYGDDGGTVNRGFSSSDVDMVDEVADDDDKRISSHRNKFDRIRLDEYRAHLVDAASEVIQSFYETCHAGLDSTNNNSNIDAMPAVLTTSIAIDIPHSPIPYPDLGIMLPISKGYQPMGHSEKPVTTSAQNDQEKKRPRKRVSFTSAPSVKWFRKDDRIEMPTRRREKNNLIAVLRQLVLSEKKYREEDSCKLKVIPILKKKYKRLKALPH